jgi:uncharacterized protein (DUF1810 family)
MRKRRSTSVLLLNCAMVGSKVTGCGSFFPQLAGLGHSPMARRFAIRSREEAVAYLGHGVLGPRLRECTTLVNAVEGRTIREILGSPDDLKFCSSMTLFGAVSSDAAFAAAIAKFYGGRPDRRTLDLLAR